MWLNMEENKNGKEFWQRNAKDRGHLEDHGVDIKIT
jgi:hypothetical protein